MPQQTEVRSNVVSVFTHVKVIEGTYYTKWTFLGVRPNICLWSVCCLLHEPFKQHNRALIICIHLEMCLKMKQMIKILTSDPVS